MKNLVTFAVISTLMIVVYSQDDVYEGSTSFLVYVVLRGTFLCGASLISSKNALAPYKKELEKKSDPSLVLMVRIALGIENIVYDKKDPRPDKFAVILLRESLLTEINSEPWIKLPPRSDHDDLKCSDIKAYAIGWQKSGGSLMKKSYEITSTIHTPTDIGVWINDKIHFQTYFGGALIKQEKLIGLAHFFDNRSGSNKTYVLYLNVMARHGEICQLLENIDRFDLLGTLISICCSQNAEGWSPWDGMTGV